MSQAKQNLVVAIAEHHDRRAFPLMGDTNLANAIEALIDEKIATATSLRHVGAAIKSLDKPP